MAAENPEYIGQYGSVRRANTPGMVIKNVRTSPPHELQFISNTVVSKTGNDRQRVATLNMGKKYVMPDLGFDLRIILNDIEKNKDKYNININMLLLQIHKLLFQLVIFSYYNLIHCDIKLENIMCDMTSGLMTLIDFDFISKFTNPNEFITIITPRIKSIILGETHYRPGIPPEFIPTDQKSRMDYITQFYNRFNTYLTTTKKYGTNDNEIWRELIKLLVQNPSMIEPDIKSCKTFDSFSLSYSLLTFLSYLEKHYNKLVTSNEALDETFTLLETMGALDVTSRTEIIPAYEKMNGIIQKIFPEYATIETYPPIETVEQFKAWVEAVNAKRIEEEKKIIGKNTLLTQTDLQKYVEEIHAKEAADLQRAKEAADLERAKQAAALERAKQAEALKRAERAKYGHRTWPDYNNVMTSRGGSYSRKQRTRKHRTRKQCTRKQRKQRKQRKRRASKN